MVVGPVIRARGLVKRYGPLEAVRGIDLEVQPGECFGLLGPNGAGKTSTLRMIYRVSPITAGELEVLGIPAGRGRDREIKARLGVVPQLNNLDEELTVRENLLVYARYYDLTGPEVARRVDELLAFMELSGKANVRVEALSGGMLRRLVLARALIHRPELLILDEPTTGLDPQARHLIWARLEALKARGVTLLLTTHYMEEAGRLCDRLAVMDEGRIVAQGTPAELIERHAAPEVLELQPAAPLDPRRLRRSLNGQLRDLEVLEDRWLLYVEDGRRALQRVEALNLPLRAAFLRPGNLEDVFLRLTGRRLREG